MNRWKAKLLICLSFPILNWVSPGQVFADEKIDFDSQVIPLLTKLGCNSGACHGSAKGRGGFRLSLFGSNPQKDFDAIVRAASGRRVNLSQVDASLLLMKPGGELDHGGEQLFEFDDPAGKRLLRWIEQGATRSSTASLVRLDFGESPKIIESLDRPIQLAGVAHFSDGRTRDVSEWIRFESQDSAAIQVDEHGVATLKKRGRHNVIARFMDQVVPIEIIVPADRKSLDLSSARRNNWIDDEIYRKLEQLRIEPGRPISDEAFLRRVTLDLTGRLPTLEQRKRFLGNPAKTRRAEYIDQLLESPAFTDYWTFRIARQLRLRSRGNDRQATKAYGDWLRSQLDRKVGWDRVANALLLASGDTHRQGAANFFRTTSDPRLQAEFLTESLLGVRLRCANCHDHPLDQWKQDDYHGLAAIMARTSQGRVVQSKPRAQVIHPETGRAALAKIPGAQYLKDPLDEPRKQLAGWVVAPENPYFAKAAVNRIWAALLGRGLVDPVDDLRTTNPATHSRLLKRLTNDFIENRYDLRSTIRLIANSAAYQRRFAPPGTDPLETTFYAHTTIRPLPAEVLADAIDDVTGIQQTYPGQKPGVRAVQILDSSSPSDALDILGRCDEGSCEGGGSGTAGIARQLHLFNGKLLNQKFNQSNRDRLSLLLKQGKTNQDIVRIFYVRCLGHEPNEEQIRFWTRALESDNTQDQASERKKRLQDFVWSILACKEFTTNH